jgi:hypothetical protein
MNGIIGAAGSVAGAVVGAVRAEANEDYSAPKQQAMQSSETLRNEHVKQLMACPGLMIRERVEFGEELQALMGIEFFQQPNKMRVALMPAEVAEAYTNTIDDEAFKKLNAEFIVCEKPPSLFENVVAQTGAVGAALGAAAAIATGGKVGTDTMMNAIGMGTTWVHVIGSSGVPVYAIKVYTKEEPCCLCCKNMVRTNEVYLPEFAGETMLGKMEDIRDCKGEGMCLCELFECIYRVACCCGQGFDIMDPDGTRIYRVQEGTCCNLCGGHCGMLANFLCCAPSFCCAERRQILSGECVTCAQPCSSGIIANVEPLNCGSAGCCNCQGWLRCFSDADNYMVKFPEEATSERDRALLFAAAVLSFSSDFVKNNNARLGEVMSE